ncbi:hypothetical protein DXT96_05890 [Agrobacterium sp. ICMP 6402]|uniref:hypothetical protein n=1 Tax=Agrobacterium sp. ICMP 6402 TaxID=2292443 RepID=UPI00129590C8|nr:hypothetical protein [Agrobacterium sp. ICMP 6402]MQB09393.1 hypothetical protein [Agrobacterium sp. ICMP 6402]
MMEKDWISNGVSTLEQLCTAVGLAIEGDLEAPAGVTLWSSAYAAVAFWPMCEDQLVIDASKAEAWFADYLFGEERRRNARVVDGYLLLAFAQPVTEALLGAVRSVELSTQICRKHAVWPETNGEWRRLDAVTVLGLPKAVTSASGEPAWPVLDSEAASLWARIQTSGPKRAAEAEEIRP